MADFAAPVAMSDNHGGTSAAVEHLIGLGHTRIGFVGNLAQQDPRERRAAYAQALATYDLPVDPALANGASDKAEVGATIPRTSRPWRSTTSRPGCSARRLCRA